MRVRLAVVAVVAAAGAMSGLADMPVALAGVGQDAVASTNPVAWTPNVLNGTVHAIAVVGDSVVVGGDFTRVEDIRSGRAHSRSNLFAFDRRTGALRGISPTFDGPVMALAAGDSNSVYVGGRFRRVNGAPRGGLVRLSIHTGTPDNGFAGRVTDGEVQSLAATGAHLFVGGSFREINGQNRAALARLDARTGRLDSSFVVRLHAPALPRPKVVDFALSPDGQRLVFVGWFDKVNGQTRHQIAMVSAGPGSARLRPWRSNAYADRCGRPHDTYMRGVDFAPNGSYLVVVTSGWEFGARRICKTAARFESDGRGAVRPSWVNHTGGHSLSAVAATGAAVYIGGHQLWMNNPFGVKTRGRGSVYRPGIAALDPRTGVALPWNPTSDRGRGIQALHAAPEGVYVGSDTTQLGREYHARLGLFPLT